MKIIECVPNISEGRNNKIIDEIVTQVKSNKNIKLLDVDIGYDTNRTVITFVGSPEEVIISAFNLIKKASELIDMKHHKGEHPRMGATDVCPLIPVQNISILECVKLSKTLSKKVAKELNIPVYLYENSATSNNRINLSNIRKGEYEGFENKIKQKEWTPDYGSNNFNKKSGVIAIGAREYLIAYNINLNTTDKKIASDIALDIRETGRLKRDKNKKIIRDEKGNALRVPGKFKFCKAVGWYIEEYDQAQVSINLTNYKKTKIYKVFEEVRKQARKRGVRVTGSEIVGLIPFKAIYETGIYYLKKQNMPTGIHEEYIINSCIKSLGLNDINNFNPKNKIIENYFETNNYFSQLNIVDFIKEVSLPTPTPGGGSCSSFASAIGTSLGSMVSNLTYNKKGYEKYNNYHNKKSEECQKYIKELLILTDEDSKSYDKVIDAMRLPKKTDYQKKIRNKMIEKATKHAAEIPLKILSVSSKSLNIIKDIMKHANENSISDLAVAAELLKSGSNGAIYNIKINIADLNSNIQKSFNEKIDYYNKINNDSYLKITNYVNTILDR